MDMLSKKEAGTAKIPIKGNGKKFLKELD